jgi:hypothetical protein
MNAQHVGEGLSIITVVATLAGILPPVAALFSIVWCSIQIYEWWKKKK